MDDLSSEGSMIGLAIIIWTSLVAVVVVFTRLELRGWSSLGRRR